MRRHLVALGITLVAAGAFAQDRGLSMHSDSEFGDCDARRVRFGGEPAVMERVEIPASGLRSLKVRSGRGPVSVRGGNAYSIVVCKAAESASALRGIDVRLNGNELTASGPSGDDDQWLVSYMITVPRGADIAVEASNGPVSIKSVDGRINARAINGPLSLKEVSGDVTAETTNGPVSFAGGSGNVKISAQNGPLTVKLSGAAWEGGSLDASTKNGPLSVKVPRGYRSGVTVETSGHGPLSCKAEGCEQYRSMRRGDDWERNEPRTIELGSGTRNVRISSVNGPVTIKDAE